VVFGADEPAAAGSGGGGGDEMIARQNRDVGESAILGERVSNGTYEEGF